MTESLDQLEAPSELKDALARIDQAKNDYVAFAGLLNEFLYDYVKGMEKGHDPETGNFVVRLRNPKESNITGQPAVAVAQIVENLRSALDYVVFELSALNEPELNERVLEFVITTDSQRFEDRAKDKLKYLTVEQKDFVEQLQPFNGNVILEILSDIAGPTKHRRLLSIRDITSLDIYFAEIEKKVEYEDCYMYPMENGKAIFARPKDGHAILLSEKYDAMKTLKAMIEQVDDIVRISSCFFQGRPLQMTIVKE